MIIKLTGTREGETVQLVKTRKPEGPLLKWEYSYQKDSNSPITAYRKKLSNEIADFQLNRVNVRKGEFEGKPTRTYSLRITYGGKSHIIDLGGGMTAQSVVNSMISLKDMTEEERNASDLNISFYNNKEWYASASVRKTGELLPWFIKNEEKAQYVETAMAFGKELKNYDKLDQKIEELIAELNETLPAGASSGHNALDEDEDGEASSTEWVSDSSSPSLARSSNSASQGIPFDDAPTAEVEV